MIPIVLTRCVPSSILQLISRLPAAGEELATRENSTPYREIIPPSPLPPLQLPRSPAPALPPQTSQDSSSRSIPPSSSSLTSPSNLSSRPAWPGQGSRVSTTLHSHSHSAHQFQPRSARPSTESTGHAPAPAERQRSANGLPSQLPARRATAKLPARAITPQRKPDRNYCQPCGISKPPRTHHCRTCDKVRLCFIRLG